MATPPAPKLLPILRSEQQARVLASLFLNDGEAETQAALASDSGVTHQRVSQILPELLEAGMVKEQAAGRRKLYSPNHHHPAYQPVKQILALTYGPAVVLASELSRYPEVQKIAIFGSWARRILGTPGPFPRDLDVLIIGDGQLPDEIHDALDRAEDQLGQEVNPIQLTQHEWETPTRALIRATKTSGE